MKPLSDGHWTMENFTERMTSKEWKEHLLNEDDKIIMRGRCRQLKARRLGCGIVEIYKVPLKED